MRVFIIRPFGIKEDIDFERVDRELIQPALLQLWRFDYPVEGGTTGQISEQGNIREDMFRLIAVSDLVIADVSIHNANVFYELGIRHALRTMHTVLIRSKTEHAYPFDLQTERYVLYDASNPAADVGKLVATLRTTMASHKADSPMFELLPALVPHGRGQLIKVPTDFKEDLEQALATQRSGNLRLYAFEVLAFEWDQEGLIAIGDAQFKLRAFAGARETFERLVHNDHNDLHANLRLATIYQRLAMSEPPVCRADLLQRSNAAIERVMTQAASSLSQRVEAYCLSASNEKNRWIDELASLPARERRSATLRSTHFRQMQSLYLKAFKCDLNAHYPAVNALAWLNVQMALAKALPDVWQDEYDSPAIASNALAQAHTLAGHIASTLRLALGLDELMGSRTEAGAASDAWILSSRADYTLLTNCERIGIVERAYREALTNADRFTLEATRRNLDIYLGLSLFEPGVSAALKMIDSRMEANKSPALPAKVLLFTGHMIDPPGLPAQKRRFPRTAEATERARALIRLAVAAEIAGRDAATVLGIAGGACGGDILFHEVCAEFGVATELYLALPEARFELSSVQRGGPEWVERFHALTRRLRPTVLQPGEDLPKWLAKKADYNVWQRCNLWMMFTALSSGARERSVLALHNCEREADGPGGTAHLLKEATSWGFKVVDIDARALLTP